MFEFTCQKVCCIQNEQPASSALTLCLHACHLPSVCSWPEQYDHWKTEKFAKVAKCTCVFTHICALGVILDNFIVCVDVCHIGSSERQYPHYNRKRKAFVSFSYSVLFPFFGFILLLFLCLNLFSTIKAHTSSYYSR